MRRRTAWAGLGTLDALELGTFGEDGMRPRGTWRLGCSVFADLRSGGSAPVRVRLCDVSGAGFMAECDHFVPIGSTVSLDLPGVGLVHARIRWSVGGRIGGRFMQPIDFAACRTGIEAATNTA